MGARSGSPAASRWVNRLLWISAFGVLLAILPLLIALVGLAVDSMYLQTYHWLLFYSVPAGLLIAVPSGVVALGLYMRSRKRNRT